MGYCTEPPKGVCSRAFVEGGTHNTNFDGVCFYPRWSLPGYAAIFRYADDSLQHSCTANIWALRGPQHRDQDLCTAVRTHASAGHNKCVCVCTCVCDLL